MKINRQFPIALGLILGLQVQVQAGSEATAAPEAPSNPGDWCTWLQNKPGTLYKNQENAYLQEFQLEGRLQYQLGYVDGSDVNGNDFSETHDEYRRFRLGAKGKFLQYFGFKYQVNLVNDSRNASGGGELEWGYDSIDEAYLSFDLGKAWGSSPFDSLKLSYGRHKFVLGQEAHESSTKLLTIERSAISNKVYDSARPTGLSVEAVKGDWVFNTALFSSTTDGAENEAFNGWQDGVMYYAGAGYKVNDELTLGTDFVYNAADVADGEDSVIGYAWATSLNAQYGVGPWGIIGDLIYGDNGGSRLGNSPTESGDFWGVVVMPYYWIIEDKLQLVGQYQFQGSSEDEGVRINSRYGRANGTGDISGIDVNSGRGDSHHSLYAGLNYYLCGHNAKLQAGIEYQTMDTPNGDFDTMTYLLGFRTFF